MQRTNSVGPVRMRVLVSCVIATAISGCATTRNLTSEETEILQTAQAWQESLKAERFDCALQMVSLDFTSSTWADKDALAVYLAEAKARGFFLNAEIGDTQQIVSVHNGEARIYPIILRANLGLAVFDLSLRRKGPTWEIARIEMELY